jgi:hypothetical protein
MDFSFFFGFSDFGFWFLVLAGNLESEAKGNADKSANGGANEDLKKGFHGLAGGGFGVSGFERQGKL